MHKLTRTIAAFAILVLLLTMATPAFAQDTTETDANTQSEEDTQTEDDNESDGDQGEDSSEGEGQSEGDGAEDEDEGAGQLTRRGFFAKVSEVGENHLVVETRAGRIVILVSNDTTIVSPPSGAVRNSGVKAGDRIAVLADKPPVDESDIDATGTVAPDRIRTVTALHIHVTPGKPTRSHERSIVTQRCEALGASGEIEVLDREGNVARLAARCEIDSPEEGDDVVLLKRQRGLDRAAEVRASIASTKIDERLAKHRERAGEERTKAIERLELRRAEAKRAALARIEARAPEHTRDIVRRALTRVDEHTAQVRERLAKAEQARAEAARRRAAAASADEDTRDGNTRRTGDLDGDGRPDIVTRDDRQPDGLPTGRRQTRNSSGDANPADSRDTDRGRTTRDIDALDVDSDDDGLSDVD